MRQQLQWRKLWIFWFENNTVNDGYSYYPYSSSRDYDFFSIGDQIFDFSDRDSSGQFFKINFILDSKYQVIQRQVFTVLDLISQVGGVNQIILLLLSFFMHIFISKVYMETLLSNFYQIDQNHEQLMHNAITPKKSTVNSKIYS